MTYTALIMAARRPGATDPLAEKAGVTHKCLIDMDGEIMIERVIKSLTGSAHIGRILISVESPGVLKDLPSLKSAGDTPIALVQSGENLFESVKLALGDDGTFPAIICTADNALQLPEMIDHFCAEFDASDADAAVALTPAEVIWAKYPEGQRRPYELKDGKFSNCNLFGIRSLAALQTARAFRKGGQFGKSKLRILGAFGLTNLLLYHYNKLTLTGAFERLSKTMGAHIVPVIMPFAEAPIDVDNERTERIAREILVARRTANAA